MTGEIRRSCCFPWISPPLLKDWKYLKIKKKGFISNQIRPQYDFQLCKYIHTYVSSNIEENKQYKKEIVLGKDRQSDAMFGKFSNCSSRSKCLTSGVLPAGQRSASQSLTKKALEDNNCTRKPFLADTEWFSNSFSSFLSLLIPSLFKNSVQSSGKLLNTPMKSLFIVKWEMVHWGKIWQFHLILPHQIAKF